jgi:hypothetical protein
VSAEAIARLADEGKDVSRFFTNKGRMMGPIQRVNVDLASGMLEELDRAARDLNISRQAVIKTLIRQALDQQYLARRSAPCRLPGTDPNVSSCPLLVQVCGGAVQLVRRLPVTQEVAGSSPVAPGHNINFRYTYLGTNGEHLCTRLIQTEVFKRHASNSSTDIRLDDQFKYGND